MIKRALRVLKHRWMDVSDSRRALDAAAVARLEAAVKASELRHGGEMRIVVEAGLPWSYLWQGLGAHARAITLFGKLRVWDTEANNGVLIYLLLADHAIEILADRGLNCHVSPAQWAELVAGLGKALKDRQFEQGLLQAVAAVDGQLCQHFAVEPGQINANELPDTVILR